MLFNSLDYLLFLGIAIAGFWALLHHRVARLAFIFAASCAFYMAWNPYYIVLILGSTVIDYVCGAQIFAIWERQRELEREAPGNTYRENNIVAMAARLERSKKRWLYVSLATNLGLLGTFKYFNFFSSASADVLSIFGFVIESPPVLNVLLPVGISFYTFQTLSYTIDIYRGRLTPAKSVLEFAFFVTYFPQLVAGPIVRASELLPQLTKKPRLTRTAASRGLFLIGTGLVKKVAVADFLSVNVVDRAFDQPELYTSAEIVVALYAFTMQIYCDFSGYTDVARGSAMLMGLDLPENFDRPYQATNPAAFWRRWHMTLSTWLRDYLYFPLGGSRGAPWRAYWNLWLTMFIIGMWHGASWTFVVYGSMQATAMVIHRFLFKRSGRTKDTKDSLWLHIAKVIACMQFVVFSRILFRASSWQNAEDVTNQLLEGSTLLGHITPTVWAVLIGTFVLHYTPKKWFASIEATFIKSPAAVQGVLLVIVGAQGFSLLLVCGNHFVESDVPE